MGGVPVSPAACISARHVHRCASYDVFSQPTSIHSPAVPMLALVAVQAVQGLRGPETTQGTTTHPLLHAFQPTPPGAHSFSDTQPSLHRGGSWPNGKAVQMARTTPAASRAPRYCFWLTRTCTGAFEDHSLLQVLLLGLWRCVQA